MTSEHSHTESSAEQSELRLAQLAAAQDWTGEGQHPIMPPAAVPGYEQSRNPLLDVRHDHPGRQAQVQVGDVAALSGNAAVVVQDAGVAVQPAAVVVWHAAVVLGLTVQAAGDGDLAAAGHAYTQAAAGWDWESSAVRWRWVFSAAGGVFSGCQEWEADAAFGVVAKVAVAAVVDAAHVVAATADAAPAVAAAV